MTQPAEFTNGTNVVTDVSDSSAIKPYSNTYF